KACGHPRTPLLDFFANIASEAAGSPAKANPCRRRSPSKMRKESANGMMKNGITDPNKDSLINTVRPIRSDKIPKMMRPIINPIIVNDKVRLASDGDTENSFTNTGRSGCTAYMDAKVKNDPIPRQSVIFQKC